MDVKLSDLLPLQSAGSFGTFGNALIWLTLSSVLMLMAPGVGGLFYILVRDRTRRVPSAPSQAAPDTVESGSRNAA